MKKLIAALALMMIQASAFAETLDVDKDTLKDMYEYCLSMQENETVNDTELLSCINEELEYGDYNKFKSLEDVKAAME